MNATCSLVLGLCLISTAPGLAHAQLPPAPAAVAEASHAALERYPSAGLGIVRIEAGVPVWAHYEGQAAPHRTASADTLFNVGSITKIFTAELALQLAAYGHLDLDAPIADSFVHPHLADDPLYQTLTARHILTHQSGLLNWEYNYEDRRLAFTFPPGEGFHYSGVGFEILSESMAAQMDTSFANLLRAYVLAPFDVEAYFGATQAPDTREVVPMGADGEYGAYQFWEETVNAADNLFITSENLANFLVRALGQERPGATPRRTLLVADGSIEACTLEQPGQCPEHSGYALGWQIVLFDGAHFAGHGGSDWGENAMAFVDVDSGDGYVVTVNGGRGLGVWLDLLLTLEPDNQLVGFYASIPNVQRAMEQMRAE